MRGELVLVGASHRTAPIAMRERLALPPARATEVLAELIAEPGLREAVVLSTCGRTELYAVASEPAQAERRLAARLASHAGYRPDELAGVVGGARGRGV